MTTKLVFIRHGQTLWNKQGRYCGDIDIALSRKGKIQVRALYKNIKGVCFDRIYSSNKKRALQTEAMLFGKRDFVKLKGLSEINFGVLEGLSHAQILKKYPLIYKAWLVDPYKGRIPKAETMQVFKKRVWAAVKKIISGNPGKTIAVVCHGGVIGILVSSILKNRNFWKYVPSSASVTVVGYRNSKYKIELFNDDGSMLKSTLSRH